MLTNIYTHRNELAEKVQELETLLQGSKLMVDEALESIEKLQEENQRFTEALEFYADRETYTDDRQYTSTGTLVHTGFTKIECDCGEKARRALRGEST